MRMNERESERERRIFEQKSQPVRGSGNIRVAGTQSKRTGEQPDLGRDVKMLPLS